jgi:hypothetical protein
MTWVDRRHFLELYPSAHLALQVVSLWAVACVIVAFGPVPRRWLRSRRAMLAVSVLLALLPLALVRNSDDPTVDRILNRPLPALALSIHRDITDFDRDGYSSLLGGGDCEPWRPSANPGAAEVPDNGIDDNCRYGDRVTQIETGDDEPAPRMLCSSPWMRSFTIT